MTNTLNQVDCDALELAIKKCSADQDIEGRLKHASRGEVGLLCAYSCQYDALQLEPWQTAPMDADESDTDEAGRLLRQMVSLGISRYAPNPIAGIETAARKRK
jgi:hypothetical protein